MLLPRSGVHVAWSMVPFFLTLLAAFDVPAQEKPGRVEGAYPAGAQQALAAVGIDDGLLLAARDGSPLEDSEQEVLLRALFRIPGFSPLEVEAWSQPAREVEHLVADSRGRRGEFFHLEGHVHWVEKCTPPPRLIQRFEIDHYYRCRALLQGGRPATIFARTIPDAWSSGGPNAARFDARAMFLKVGGLIQDQPAPVFVTARVAWHPDTPLGKLGMDVGLLDDLQDDRPLTTADHEAFYQLLAAVGRSTPDELRAVADRQPRPTGASAYDSVVPLFNEPRTQRGRLVSVAGTVRNVTRVTVDDPDVVARLGFRDYYQFALFAPDAQDNPLIVCARQLPPGLAAGAGSAYDEAVRVAGFFFKKWGYQTDETPAGSAAPGKVRKQLAPLLVALEPERYEPSPAPRDPLGMWLAGGLAAVAFVVATAVWRHAGRSPAAT